MTKVLVIGSGGREHALAWRLAKSEGVEKVWVAPGNAGTAADSRLENLPITDIEALRDWKTRLTSRSLVRKPPFPKVWSTFSAPRVS